MHFFTVKIGTCADNLLDNLLDNPLDNLSDNLLDRASVYKRSHVALYVKQTREPHPSPLRLGVVFETDASMKIQKHDNVILDLSPSRSL